MVLSYVDFRSPPDNTFITGLSNLEKLVEKWTETPSTYSPTEMRACLDTFREVLFHHLDEEVSELVCLNKILMIDQR